MNPLKLRKILDQLIEEYGEQDAFTCDVKKFRERITMKAMKRIQKLKKEKMWVGQPFL